MEISLDPTVSFNYMVAGYVVFTVVISLYITNLISRWKKLKDEQRMLGELETK
jgi:hypothetical protein